MKYLIYSFLIICSLNAFAQDHNWILRAKIETMRSNDQIWINDKGDFYWATSMFHDSMPCSTTLNESELIEVSALIQSLPSVPYERDFNNQCKDGLRFFILSSSKQGDGTTLEVGKKFPASKDCRINAIDKAWDDLSGKLYVLTQEKFKSCRGGSW
jgi:hypothetical protein